MKERAELKDTIAKTVAAIYGPRSPAKKLQAALRKVQSPLPANSAEVVEEAKAALAACRARARALQKLAENIDSVKKDAFEQVKLEGLESTAEGERESQECDDQLEAVQFILSKGWDVRRHFF